jgi:hypothetical protein
MQKCWACGHVIRAAPEVEDDRRQEDLEVVCPECLTEHVYTEDADGNLVVTEAVRPDGTVLHAPSAR